MLCPSSICSHTYTQHRRMHWDFPLSKPTDRSLQGRELGGSNCPFQSSRVKMYLFISEARSLWSRMMPAGVHPQSIRFLNSPGAPSHNLIQPGAHRTQTKSKSTSASCSLVFTNTLQWSRYLLHTTVCLLAVSGSRCHQCPSSESLR